MSSAVRRSFTSLAVPNYRRYFVGQIVSLSGNWMQVIAEMWLILSLTGSGDVDVVRQPMPPMRGDLLALFDPDERKKYYTAEEIVDVTEVDK